MRAPLVLSLGLLGLGGLGALIEYSPWFAPHRRVMRDSTVPAHALDSGTYGDVLRELDLVTTIQPEVDWRWRGKPRGLAYTAYPGARSLPDSAALATDSLADGWTTISLALDEQDFDHPKYGLISNGKSGIERKGSLSYFEGHDRRFSGPCGVRLHGHPERDPRGWSSFRLYLRSRYGPRELPDALLPRALIRPLDRLIIRGESVTSTALSFDIARRVGSIAPDMRPARFVLNGEDQGVYSLTEHLTRRAWESRLGHGDFAFVRSRGTNSSGDQQAGDELSEWAHALGPEDARMDVVGRRVDLDNLSRHLFVIAWCGTNDWAQGAMVLDRTQQEPRWRWIHWDMDRGLRPTSHLSEGPAWSKRALDLLLGELPLEPGRLEHLARSGQNNSVRGVLFKKLLRNDPEYRKAFLRIASDAMNHRLTPEFFEERLRYYASYVDGRRLTVGILRRVQEFVLNRSPHVREDLQRVLDLDAALPCRVLGPEGSRVLIDGHERTLPYEGWYFPGQDISVDRDAPDGWAWRVGDGPASSAPCRLEVRAPLEVRIEIE